MANRSVLNPNIEQLRLAIMELGELATDFVFVGGCATGLLVTDPAAPPIRQTIDVDAIVELSSLLDYHKLSARLHQYGFTEDSSTGAPICRWKKAGLLLDIMPTNEKILGFGNPWYAPALAHAETCQLPTGETLALISAPFFLMTKLAAFAGRGQDNYQASHDLEDLLAVIDGRPEIIDEVKAAPEDLQKHLQQDLSRLLAINSFRESLTGHLPPDEASQARVPVLLERLRSLAG